MINQEQYEARKLLIDEMKKEMLGPGSEHNNMPIETEIISTDPAKRYSVGILYPQGHTFKKEDDDLEGTTDSDKEEIVEDQIESVKNTGSEETTVHVRTTADSEDTIDETVNMSSKLLPSSMGMTFVAPKKLEKLNVQITFATYRKIKLTECKIPIPEEEQDHFCIPEVFETYFGFDKEKNQVTYLNQIEPKRIRDIYESDRADDGTFKSYAYKMTDLLKSGYVREPKEYEYTIDFKQGDYYNPQEPITGEFLKVNALRYKLENGYYSYTVMLINSKSGASLSGINCIFQPVLRINSSENEMLSFCDYSHVNYAGIYTEDEMSNALLYRNKSNYASGLGVATDWEISDDGKGYIQTDYFPIVEVPQMEFQIPDKYQVSENVFNMKYLSDLDSTSKEIKIKDLRSLSAAYEQWIDILSSKAEALDAKFVDEAHKHVHECRYCLDRINKGIEIIEKDEISWNSFVLSNRAMFMQRVQVGIQGNFDNVIPNGGEEYDKLTDILENINYLEYDGSKCEWRPFQLAFLLMSIPSIKDEDTKQGISDRDLVDLIWFPTGGGKTEAYLGLTAFTIFYRRLSFPEESGGTTVIMRYTLRLLAAQQFTRASTLICACELIRYEAVVNKKSKYPKYPLGDEKISIGLWIGGDHTPNKLKKAKECYDQLSKVNSNNINNTKEKYNKFQVLKCPWCGTKMVKELDKNGKVVGSWGYRMPSVKHFYLTCTNEYCHFYENNLPLQVVDEEIYNNPPTLLFATVDKFAMMPWYSEIGNFFATNTNKRAPELIIQDELHLISGPLGSMVGLYETAIDYLCSRKGTSPKIIASTATICRAKEQCSELYNRDVFQYPAQGLDESDSFFARAADPHEKYGRVYIGLLPAGKTKAMMESKILAALLQLEKEADLPDEIKDSYWTVTAYFNSLKELGKCSTIVQNDVRDNIRRFAHRNLNRKGIRNVLRADELTSRVSTTELNQTLEKLEKVKYVSDADKKTGYASNILLATNMISVGIDVDRLNVMVMVGQPKLTSEYIQASSRVGRKYPGVVFTMYDGTRSRDRSHYEQFKAYHESFYKYVEPTGVTPFSEPARQRALHAMLFTILRHGMELETDEQLSEFDQEKMKAELQDVSHYICERITEINKRQNYNVQDESKDVGEEIESIYDKIQILSNQSGKNLEYGNVMGFKNADGKRRLMKPFGTYEDEAFTFDTMTSMRNVDSEVPVNVVFWED